MESCQEVLWPDGEKFEPSQVYTLPAGLAPEVVFQGVEGHVTLRSKRMAGNAMGAEWQGRTFFISLRSPDVVPATEVGRRTLLTTLSLTYFNVFFSGFSMIFMFFLGPSALSAPFRSLEVCVVRTNPQARRAPGP